MGAPGCEGGSLSKCAECGQSNRAKLTNPAVGGYQCMCLSDRQPRTAEKVSGRHLSDRRGTGAVRVFPPASKGAGGDRGSADGGPGVAAGVEGKVGGARDRCDRR